MEGKMFLSKKNKGEWRAYHLVNLDLLTSVRKGDGFSPDCIKFYNNKKEIAYWVYSESRRWEIKKHLNALNIIIENKAKYDKSILPFCQIVFHTFEPDKIYFETLKLNKEQRSVKRCNIKWLCDGHNNINNLYEYGFYQSQFVVDTEKEGIKLFNNIEKLLKAANQLIEI